MRTLKHAHIHYCILCKFLFWTFNWLRTAIKLQMDARYNLFILYSCEKVSCPKRKMYVALDNKLKTMSWFNYFLWADGVEVWNFNEGHQYNTVTAKYVQMDWIRVATMSSTERNPEQVCMPILTTGWRQSVKWEPIPHQSQFCLRNVHHRLHFHKVCARLVPEELVEQQGNNHLNICNCILCWYHEEGDFFWVALPLMTKYRSVTISQRTNILSRKWKRIKSPKKRVPILTNSQKS
jgi:hypothetical protein